jgi:hypothetical protein
MSRPYQSIAYKVSSLFPETLFAIKSQLKSLPSNSSGFPSALKLGLAKASLA